MLTFGSGNPSPRRVLEILLIDDSHEDVRLMTEALKETPVPYRLRVCRSGADAAALLSTCGLQDCPCPDLVLLDLNMPGKNGHEILRDMKSRDETRQVPVVIISSSTADQDVEQAYRSHANCYVRKPTTFSDMQRVMRAMSTFWFAAATLPQYPCI